MLTYKFFILFSLFYNSLVNASFKYDILKICNNISSDVLLIPNSTNTPLTNDTLTNAPLTNAPSEVDTTNKKCIEKDINPIFIPVWGACGGYNLPTLDCQNSVCIKYSSYYSQCLPLELNLNDLCGQNDNKDINWMYNKCKNSNCLQYNTVDFRCQ